jgi:hypothetical protein
MVAYDNGLVTEVGVSQLHIWDKKLSVGVEIGGVETGVEAKKTLSPSHAGSKAYMNEIEKLHPGYLRELFRQGVQATFAELADAANQKSAAPGEDRSTLSVGKTQCTTSFQTLYNY